MSRLLAIWAAVVAIVLAVVGLWQATDAPGDAPGAASVFTESTEPELPPAADEAGLVEGPHLFLTR
jgi:hypothetical protein